MIDSKLAQYCADVMQAIAEPNRVQIIDILRTGPKNVTEISKIMQEEIVNVSHHLGVLREHGMVEDRKDGRFVIYTLHPNYFKVDPSNTTVIDLGWCRIEIPLR